MISKSMMMQKTTSYHTLGCKMRNTGRSSSDLFLEYHTYIKRCSQSGIMNGMEGNTKKKWVLRLRASDAATIQAIKARKKIVETRAATAKYRDVKKGDTLVIVCGKQRFERTIKTARHFKSIAALFKAVPYKKIMPYAATAAEARATYYGYPGYREKLKKYGVFASWI